MCKFIKVKGSIDILIVWLFKRWFYFEVKNGYKWNCGKSLIDSRCMKL